MIYERIRALREDADLTQAKMAKLLSVHQTTYSDYELGKLDVPTKALCKIADAMDTSVDYLLERTDEKRPYPPKKA